MPVRCVALLRGVNVGTARRIAMADLRAVAEQLGCTGVKTLLNSGNLVFTAPSGAAALQTRLAQAIRHELGVDTRVTLLTAAELGAILAENPLRKVARNPSRYIVSVPQARTDRRKLLPLTREPWRPEAFALGARAGYLWIPDGVTESRLAKAVERALAPRVTSRNWSTMQKLHTLAAG